MGIALATYNPTNWQNGVTALSDTNLNHIEQGVHNVTDQVITHQTDIEKVAYDQYDMALALYYAGHFGGPEIAGTRGMTFDGFQDSLRIGGSNTAQVDTANKVVKLAVETAEGTLISNYTYNDGYGSSDNICQSFTLPATLGSPNLALTKINLRSNAATAAATYSWNVRSGSINGTTMGNSQMNQQALGSKAVGDTIPFGFTTSPLLNPGTKYWFVASWYSGASINIARSTANPYAGGEAYGYNNVVQSNNDFWFEVLGVWGFKVASTFLSVAKALTYTPTSAKVYLSVKTPAGTTIVPTLSCDGGAHYEALTQVSTRPDPRDASYTEIEYNVDFAYPGQSLILKADLATADKTVTPEIKRYGIQLL